jgi:hypothetical protein
MMKTSDSTMYEIPIPENLDSIRAVHDGNRWINAVIPGSVKVEHGIMSFTVKWGPHDQRRRILLATDLIGGYQCDE